jgi:glucose uptake protein GlcU
MLTVAAILFAVAAVGGLAMAYIHFSRAAHPPVVLAVVHGLFGAAGLVVLLIALMQTGVAGLGALALGIIVVAALGGFYLFSLHLRNRPLPSAVVLIHGAVAAAGFVVLLTAIALASP